jgi:pimeloyl-ACP methyl ester carboxylesterase
MTLPIIWIPGHLCGAWLYAPQLGVYPGLVADTLNDDCLGAMAERLLVDAPERFVVAGLSMGAMVAMEVIARAPERVAGAVIMDTDPSRARDRGRMACAIDAASGGGRAGGLCDHVRPAVLYA